MNITFIFKKLDLKSEINTYLSTQLTNFQFINNYLYKFTLQI